MVMQVLFIKGSEICGLGGRIYVLSNLEILSSTYFTAREIIQKSKHSPEIFKLLIEYMTLRKPFR